MNCRDHVTMKDKCYQILVQEEQHLAQFFWKDQVQFHKFHPLLSIDIEMLHLLKKSKWDILIVNELEAGIIRNQT